MKRPRSHPMRHALASLLLAASASALIAQQGEPSVAYTMTVDPLKPSVGGLVTVELKVEGFSAASSVVTELRPDSGLSVETESIRPLVPASTQGVWGTIFRFELRVLSAGTRKIDRLSIVASEGKLLLGPMVACEALADASSETASRAAGWKWVAPAQALRFEAFEARLEPEGGAPVGEAHLESAFTAPEGATIEPSGALAWTVTALEEGELVLPAVTVGKGGASDFAVPAKVEVKPMPEGISSSRAIGAFSLSLAGPEPANASADSPVRFRLVLSGAGNLPVALLPEPTIRLDGARLPRGAWTATRADDSRVGRGAYDGSSSLVIEIIPPRPGLLSLAFPAVPVLDPRAGIAQLGVPPRKLIIASETRAAVFPSSAPESWGHELDGAHALWARGDKGRALAELYRALRSAPPLSPMARSAKSRP